VSASEIEFKPFPKIARLSRECVVTEKIDGTNASIYIGEDGTLLTGSRTRWIYPEPQRDNYGFSAWALANRDELLKLGPGHHFGEWYGQGIQHGYGMKEKRFALFNTSRWSDPTVRPACCDVVPVLYQGVFNSVSIIDALSALSLKGSVMVPGWDRPEGIIIYHLAANLYFKKTIHKDEEWKGKAP
jgi:hypothetical protein